MVLNALANGDLMTARTTAEIACQAAPYDDICRLDLVKVAADQGDHEVATDMPDGDLCNRADDHLPPIDLPARTGDVLANQGWPPTNSAHGDAPAEHDARTGQPG